MKSKIQTARKWPWGTIIGFSSVGSYITFTIIAIILFPEPVSPFDVYLSRLGNADVSPDGALFYNLAVILGGVAEILFFIAVFVHYSTRDRICLWRIAVLVGIINGISVLMSGVYAEHVNMGAHTTWSYIIFISLIPTLLAFNLLFRVAPGVSKGVSGYGFLVCAIDIFFLVTILNGGLEPGLVSFMEWFSVFTFLGWVLLLSLNMLAVRFPFTENVP